MFIHKSMLPEKVQEKLKKHDVWLSGTVFFEQASTHAVFIDENEKVLFQFTKPAVVAHTHAFIKYHAVVFQTNKYGKKEGELCELIFLFDKPKQSNTHNHDRRTSKSRN